MEATEVEGDTFTMNNWNKESVNDLDCKTGIGSTSTLYSMIVKLLQRKLQYKKCIK